MSYPTNDREEIARLEAKVQHQRQEIERLEAANAALPQWTPQEQAAIEEMARKQDLPVAALYKQALRLYQQHNARLEAGETVHWSGDAQRARDFAGPLLATEDEDDDDTCVRCGAAPDECDHAYR